MQCPVSVMASRPNAFVHIVHVKSIKKIFSNKKLHILFIFLGYEK